MDRNESLVKFEAYLCRRFPHRRTPVDYLSDIRQFMAALVESSSKDNRRFLAGKG